MALVAASREARGQACCAGAGALTPGRLLLHENALVGVQVRAGTVLGSFDDGSNYKPQSAGAKELDFEQDLFAALRFLKRGQAAIFVPIVETSRSARGTPNEVGGGIGDVNASLRYDFTLAGSSPIVPGIAALLGVTAPTGTPADAATKPLATDATGVGAWQANAGIAFEQTFGPWLVNATELVAWRAPRSVQGIDESLAVQFTTILGAGYSFPHDAALGLFMSYAVEGGATLNNAPAPYSARSIFVLTLAGVLPVGAAGRLQGGLFIDPPISGFARNQTAATGLTLGWVSGF